MTNAEYIKNNISDRDLAFLLKPLGTFAFSFDLPPFIEKIRDNFEMEMTIEKVQSGNSEKYGKVNHWFWESFFKKDDVDKPTGKGRTASVAFQVWLDKQVILEHWK